MADVFISYSRKDKPKVALVAAGLRDLGVSIWMDDQLRTGDVSYDRATADALKAATAVLACWSPQASESEWARSEAAYARENKKLLACFIEHASLYPPFNLVQTEDLSDWRGEPGHERWLALIGAIGAKLGRPQIAELLKARAGGDTALLAFAQRYPDAPEAGEIWRDFEARSRKAFTDGANEAAADAAQAAASFQDQLQDALAKASSGFETWLEQKRLGLTQQAPPSPRDAVLRTKSEAYESQASRERIAALSADAARARAERADADASVKAVRREADALARQLRELRPSDGTPWYRRIPRHMQIGAATILVVVLLLLGGTAYFIARTSGQSQALAYQAGALVRAADTGKKLYWPIDIWANPSTGYAGFGDEAHDWGVSPPYNPDQHDLGNTPTQSPFASPITTQQLVYSERDARSSGFYGSLLIDVWTGYRPHATLPGAIQILGAGYEGSLGDYYEQRLDATLYELTRGNKNARIVIFCLGSNSWESYNAILRAHHAGYTNLVWYRGGLAAWLDASLVRDAPVGQYEL